MQTTGQHIENGKTEVKSSISPTQGIEVSVVRNLADLGEIADSWNALCLQNPNALPQLSHAMVSAWLMHRAKPEDTWMVLVAKCGGRLVGVLPIIVSNRQFLGLTLQTCTPPRDVHITSVDMVAEAGLESSVLSACLEKLQATVPIFAVLEMHRIAENSASATAMALPPDGHVLKRRQSGAAAYYQISGTFEGYMDSLKPNFSRNLRRLRRKLDGMGEGKFQTFSGLQFTDDLFHQFLELEASGWKGTEKGAILSSPTAPAYYREAFRNLRQLGWAELYTMQIEGTMIAAQLAVRLNRRVFLFKICYSEQYSHLGPGNVLMADTIERAFKRGDTDEINCLTDMPWHNNWVMGRQPYTSYTLTPKRIVPIAVGAFCTSTKLIKSVFARIF
jgi:CelD/BcsL family acetyltransferase involved in cellulose biosynthesis